MFERLFHARSLRQAARGLVAGLIILLAVGHGTARAADKPVARGSSSKSHHHATHRTRRAHRLAVRIVPSNGMRMGLRDTVDDLKLKSSSALVVDQDTGEMLAVKNPDVILPIASLTKLMTALVVVEAHLPMDEELEITDEDLDTERRTSSRLRVGTRLTRDQLLLLALMSSENRAALALSRNYPGGRDAFVATMNLKAQLLGMSSTHFADPAGLSNDSVSTARDLQHLVKAAYAQPLIRAYTTQVETTVRAGRGRMLKYVNSNRLVRSESDDWDIELQKTGFTNEAGRCLVMQATVLNHHLAMVFLDSSGTMTRYADAARVRKQLERDMRKPMPKPVAPIDRATESSS